MEAKSSLKCQIMFFNCSFIVVLNNAILYGHRKAPAMAILGQGEIEITSWKVRAYGFYSRVDKYRKTNE